MRPWLNEALSLNTWFHSHQALFSFGVGMMGVKVSKKATEKHKEVLDDSIAELHDYILDIKKACPSKKILVMATSFKQFNRVPEKALEIITSIQEKGAKVQMMKMWNTTDGKLQEFVESWNAQYMKREENSEMATHMDPAKMLRKGLPHYIQEQQNKIKKRGKEIGENLGTHKVLSAFVKSAFDMGHTLLREMDAMNHTLMNDKTTNEMEYIRQQFFRLAEDPALASGEANKFVGLKNPTNDD